MVLAENRKAKFDYEIIKRFTAGILLLGWEVKQIRLSRIDISNSYIKLEDRRAVLKNCIIPIPKYLRTHDKNVSDRSRILLLSNRELVNIRNQLKTKGTTFIPLKVFLNERNLIKVECALVKGSKKYDKRQKEKIKNFKKEIFTNF